MISNIDRQRRIKDLLNDVLDLQPEARDVFLNRATDDPGIRTEVRNLMHAHARADGFLADPTIGGTTRVGETIGRYTLNRLIGEGGFGSVYAAEQHAPVQRTVALKIIKLGMDTRQVIARFEAERQALAIMKHPSIATVFDAGATDTGRPYFVMEFVDGVTITEYCDRHELSIEDRLKLFIQVCGAVQHAHAKGVIHRDLKPSNLMVTMHDGAPLPKVIDFGIAKATTPRGRLTDVTVSVDGRNFIGTPQYMSPEQADENAIDIDTRSDVYSLGVVLYELLAGVSPFDGQRLRSAGNGGWQRIIREEEPPKPSTRLSSLGSLSEVAARRDIEPRRLPARVSGDLDWITLKALDKDRDRRYSSAAELAEDLRRHLGHEPVLASPPSTLYRVKKFARRNRAVVIGASAVLTVLVAGILATSLALSRAAQAADKSQRIAAFMKQMLGGIDPQFARGKDTVLLRQVFDDTAARIGTELAGQPEVEADIRTTIGRAYLALGLRDPADTHLTRALQIREEILGEYHPDTLTSMANLAALRRLQGNFVEADSHGRQALEIRRRVLGNDHPDTLVSINEMGILLADQGRLTDAEPYSREAMEGRRRVLGNDHPETLLAINNMGMLLWDQGRFEEAEVYCRESMEGQRRVLGQDHPNTIASIGNMGRLLRTQKKFAEAESFVRLSFDESRRVLGPDHPDTLSALNSMGALYFEQGRYAEAEPFFREALEGRRRVLKPDHPDTLRSINNVGAVLNVLGKSDEAEPFYREALEANRRTLTDDHPDTLRSLHNMGALLRRQEKYGEAAEYYAESLERRRRVLGSEHPDTVATMSSLARSLLQISPMDIANSQRALPLALEVNSITNYTKPDNVYMLAMAYHQTGDIAQAIDTQRQALDLLPADSPDRPAYEKTLAKYESTAKPQSAEGD